MSTNLRMVMNMTEQLTATATGRNLSISSKYAIEVCAYIRNRKLARAKAILERVIKKEEAIPFTRFTDGVGHRKGIKAAGRYPLKASQEILMILKSAEANAVNKGMTGDLDVAELRCNRAASPMRAGRQSRRQSKRTHVYVTLAEVPGSRKKAEKKAKAKPAEKTVKDETPKAEPAKPQTPPKADEKKKESTPKESPKKESSKKSEPKKEKS